MSTNYYATKTIAEDNLYDCPAKTISVVEKIHIGKYSDVNRFLLQDFWTAIPNCRYPKHKDEVIDFIRTLHDLGYGFENKYGEYVGLEDMIDKTRSSIYKNTPDDLELEDGTPYTTGSWS